MNNVNKKSNNFFSLENVFISSSILFALFCLLACFVKFCNAHSLYTVSLERYFLKLYPKRQDFSLFWKQIHVSSSSKFIITLLIRGNTLFYSSNNFNDQHVKCKPKICQRNLSNLSECSIALEDGCRLQHFPYSPLFTMIHASYMKYPKELMERCLL